MRARHLCVFVCVACVCVWAVTEMSVHLDCAFKIVLLASVSHVATNVCVC